ncbi:MAG: penicillin-binding protein activator LpoB [Planctomycetota bacterium]
MAATSMPIALVSASGCAGRQYGHLLAQDDVDMVGSHEAGAATWNPLVDEAVAKLLSRCPPTIQPATFHDSAIAESMAAGEVLVGGGVESALATGPATVCFVGLENKSAEELLDFKDQLYQRIDTEINTAQAYRSINRRMIDAALRELRLRPDSLFLPANQKMFSAVLGREGTPVDYLLFGTITSGTTDRNKSTQRDYLLTLEMVNVHTGDQLKESAKIRKGYHKARTGKWWNWGPLKQADG